MSAHHKAELDTTELDTTELGKAKPAPRGRALCRALCLALLLLPALPAAPARAQLIDRYFPAGIPGYGAAPGVTVLSRDRQSYEPLGIRTGGFVIRPTLSTGLGATTNATGQPGGRGSALVQTSASLQASTDWGRHAIGGYLSLDDQRVLAATNQSATSWTAALGGTADIGRDRLVLGAAHLDLFQTARALDGLPIDRPGRYRVNNARASYTWQSSGRLAVTPALAVTDTRYDDVFVGGRRVVQRYRDRTALEGAVTTTWELAPQRRLVLDLRANSFNHAHREPGQPSRNATTFAALAGIDYAASAVWRVRALAGLQHRSFADPSLKPVTGPSAEASAIWTPSGLTTVTATLARRIEDAAELTAVSYTFTGLHLAIDHELHRNLLLAAYLDLQQAEYQQRPNQLSTGQLSSGHDQVAGFGLGATWLLNRRLRASATWDYTTRHRADGATVDEGIALLRLRFAL